MPTYRLKPRKGQYSPTKAWRLFTDTLGVSFFQKGFWAAVEEARSTAGITERSAQTWISTARVNQIPPNPGLTADQFGVFLQALRAQQGRGRLFSLAKAGPKYLEIRDEEVLRPLAIARRLICLGVGAPKEQPLNRYMPLWISQVEVSELGGHSVLRDVDGHSLLPTSEAVLQFLQRVLKGDWRTSERIEWLEAVVSNLMDSDYAICFWRGETGAGELLAFLREEPVLDGMSLEEVADQLAVFGRRWSAEVTTWHRKHEAHLEYSLSWRRDCVGVQISRRGHLLAEYFEGGRKTNARQAGRVRIYPDTMLDLGSSPYGPVYDLMVETASGDRHRFDTFASYGEVDSGE